VARDGRTTTIDAGLVTYQAWAGSDAQAYFANIASAGMSGAVARQANLTTKALGGRVSFFAALVRVFAGWRNTELDVDVGGERRSGKMTNLIVANGRYQGGGMLIAPEAAADDGLFDVLLVGDITKRDFVLNVGKIYRGTHLSHPKIELLRGPKVSVDAAVPVPVELDGEQPGTTPATFEIVPGALRLRVPA
jgi:diacylglycerol kinase (ATP)